MAHAPLAAQRQAVLLGQGQALVVPAVEVCQPLLHAVAADGLEVEQQVAGHDFLLQCLELLRGEQFGLVSPHTPTLQHLAHAGIVEVFVGKQEVGGRDVSCEHDIDIRAEDAVVLREYLCGYQLVVDFFGEVRFPLPDIALPIKV